MSETQAPPDGVEPRFPAAAVPSITAVRLSPGDTVDLVNISKSGVLVEGRTRFVPGTRVTVVFDGGFSPGSVKAKIVRCQVSSISSGTLRYQSGIQFETKLESLDTPNGRAASAPPTRPAPTPVPSVAAPSPARSRRIANRW